MVSTSGNLVQIKCSHKGTTKENQMDCTLEKYTRGLN